MESFICFLVFNFISYSFTYLEGHGGQQNRQQSSEKVSPMPLMVSNQLANWRTGELRREEIGEQRWSCHKMHIKHIEMETRSDWGGGVSTGSVVQNSLWESIQSLGGLIHFDFECITLYPNESCRYKYARGLTVTRTLLKQTRKRRQR